MLGTVAAEPSTDAPTDGITVVGEGVVAGRPDVVEATVGVEVSADSVQPALATANERATAVIDALQAEGVDPADIQTQDISLRERGPERPPEPGEEPPDADEVVAVNVVEARIRDVEQVGEILQAAADAGGDAARIRGVRFVLEDDDELLVDARERAFDHARQKAEHYAELAGRKLGELVAVREHELPGTPPPPAPEVAADEAVPVEPGTEQRTVRVTAVWSLG